MMTLTNNQQGESMKEGIEVTGNMNGFDYCSVVELRQYTLRVGQRDTLINLFDREFVESQEALGMQVIGQFRDLDNPDRFVWLRGFADMATRQGGLMAFYGGPVWAAHRELANATMIDSDNVLLLRPAWLGGASSLRSNARAVIGSDRIPQGLIDVTIFHLREPAGAELLAWCRNRMASTLSEGGVLQQGWYITESSANNFPTLPVREGENVLVGVAVFPGTTEFQRFQRDGRWGSEVAPMLSKWLAKSPQSHRLVPTARSALHA